MTAPVVNVLVRGNRQKENVDVVTALARERKLYQTDVQGATYLIETVVRHGLSTARPYAEQLMEGVFRLMAVDPDVLEASGEVSYESERVAALQKQTGAEGFTEMARAEVAKMWERKFEISGAYLGCYAAVLKMILIGLEMKGQESAEKVRVFDNFLLETLGVMQPRLMLIARLFFAGKMAGLLKATAGNADFSRKGVFGAAFDLYITTTSEQLFSMEDARLAIITTNDHALADVIQRFNFRAVALMKDGHIRMYQEWDEEWLDATLGKEAAAALRVQLEERYAQKFEKGGVEDPDAIIAASRELEGKLGVTPDEGQLKSLLA